MKSNRRADALMRTMGGDFLLREQFVTAPSQLISEYLHSEKLPEEATGASDQLIYAIFSDEALLKTLQQRLSADPQAIDDSEKLADVLAGAVAETGAKPAITALMRASVEKVDVISRASALAVLLKGLLGGGIVAHTEMSTGHSTATEMSTGHIVAQTEMSTGHSTGTEMSTGHIVAQTEMSTGHSTATEMSTGHIVAQTEMSTGHSTGTEMSTGHIVAATEFSGGTEMTTGHSTGTMVSTAHLVASTEASGGTMMTTGHSTGTMVSTAHLVASTESSGGTMMTTGHSTGTMVSTAHSMGEIFQGPFRATLIALADYSVALKRGGALASAFPR